MGLEERMPVNNPVNPVYSSIATAVGKKKIRALYLLQGFEKHFA